MAALLSIGVAVLVGLALRAAWIERRALRRCPRCGGDAVRTARVESINVCQSQIELQCGQCETWRRRVSMRADERGHRRRLEHDRGRIGARLRQLESARRSLDFRAFIALLRSDIAGADDFLAMTRPPRAIARWPQHRRYGAP